MSILKPIQPIPKASINSSVRSLLRKCLGLWLFVLNFLGVIEAQVILDHPVPTGAASDYSTTWTVPAGVTAITVEAWGGGAGGNGNISLPPQMFVGGGGGAYAKTINFAVIPGDVLTIDIGRGGPITTGTNPNLGSLYFNKLFA